MSIELCSRVYTCCIICERDFDVAAALARPHGCIRSQVQNVLTCQVLQLGAVQCERAAALSAGAPTSICNLRPSIRSFQQCETGCHSELASLTLERSREVGVGRVTPLLIQS